MAPPVRIKVAVDTADAVQSIRAAAAALYAVERRADNLEKRIRKMNKELTDMEITLQDSEA